VDFVIVSEAGVDVVLVLPGAAGDVLGEKPPLLAKSARNGAPGGCGGTRALRRCWQVPETIAVSGEQQVLRFAQDDKSLLGSLGGSSG